MIAGILLAAGKSTRFGSHKLLHPVYDSTPMVLAALHRLQTSVDQVFVVVRPEDESLIQLLSQEKCSLVPCAHAERGMGASLACGVRAASDAQGWLIALADMPEIPADVVATLVDHLRQGEEIIAPIHENRRGHPVGFSRSYYSELMQLDGDSGARNLIAAHADKLKLIPCSDPGILRDIDTPQDLSASASG